MVSLLVVLERRVLRRVATTVARDEAERVTQDLRSRVDRLEDLDDAHRATREKQLQAAKEQLASIRDGDITSSSVGNAILQAMQDNLLDPEHFVVKTGTSIAAPVLHALPLVEPDGKIVALFLDFEPMVVDQEPIMVNGKPIPVPKGSDSTVMWMDQTPDIVGADLEAGLGRRNEPTEGFGFEYAIDRLIESIELMRVARGASAGSPKRLEGQLRVLINDAWAYTGKGLESTESTTIYPLNYARSIGPGSHRPVHLYLTLSSDEKAQADAAFSEALKWVQERHSVRLIEPGIDPEEVSFSEENDW